MSNLATMDNLIAYCGLACDSCPIHLATIEPDISRKKLMREDIAVQCSGYYAMNMRADDINDCDGCRAGTGKLFKGCLDCVIRKCAIQKHLESCAFCSEFICENLRKHFILDPESQHRLKQIRQKN